MGISVTHRLLHVLVENGSSVSITLFNAAFHVVLELLFHQSSSTVLTLESHTIIHDLFVLLKSLDIILQLGLFALHGNVLLGQIYIYLLKFLILEDKTLALRGAFIIGFRSDIFLLLIELFSLSGKRLKKILLHFLRAIKMTRQQIHLLVHLLSFCNPFGFLFIVYSCPRSTTTSCCHHFLHLFLVFRNQ